MSREEIGRHFQRERDGSFICIVWVRIDHPQGRIEVVPGTRLMRGTTFMGVDLAAWLEEMLSK